MIVLAIPCSKDVHSKSELVFAAQNVYVIGCLETGDGELPQGASAATDRKSAVIHGQLQEILGRLIEICNAERGRINAVRVRAAIVAPASHGKVDRVHRGRTQRVSVT